jgi:hypothetical protein
MDQWEIDSEGCTREGARVTCYSICVEGLRKTTKKSSRDIDNPHEILTFEVMFANGNQCIKVIYKE